MLERTEGAIKNVQSIDTGNIGHKTQEEAKQNTKNHNTKQKTKHEHGRHPNLEKKTGVNPCDCE